MLIPALRIQNNATLLHKKWFACIRWMSKDSVRVRFAPSPTGQLHLGGFRTALYNYLFAKQLGGKFVLRIEDTDQSRLVPGAAEQLSQVLHWLGVKPDESPEIGGAYGPYVQSERVHLYRQYVQQLIETGHAYRCFCTEKRLELMRKEAVKSRSPNVYDRKCLPLSNKEIESKLRSGASYTVRFKLSPFTEGYNDLVYGFTKHDVHAMEGDPIILKSDGFPTYHLANVVDDHTMNISHVLRGVEWQVSTPKHILMYKAFGWEPPQFGHLPLILNPDGSKLSKRQNDLHISALKENHYSPLAILNFVSLIGGGFEDKEYSLDHVFSLDQLIQKFNISRLNVSPGKVEMARLDDINKAVIKSRFAKDRTQLVADCKEIIFSNISSIDKSDLSDKNIEDRLSGIVDRLNNISDIVKPDLLFLWCSEFDRKDEISCSDGQIKEIIESCDYVYDFKSFQSVLKKVCKKENLKVATVMKDIRILLTGSSVGMPLQELFKLLGPEQCLHRIKKNIK